jgi:hypothetical protein
MLRIKPSQRTQNHGATPEKLHSGNKMNQRVSDQKEGGIMSGWGTLRDMQPQRNGLRSDAIKENVRDLWASVYQDNERSIHDKITEIILF